MAGERVSLQVVAQLFLVAMGNAEVVHTVLHMGPGVHHRHTGPERPGGGREQATVLSCPEPGSLRDVTHGTASPTAAVHTRQCPGPELSMMHQGR